MNIFKRNKSQAVYVEIPPNSTREAARRLDAIAVTHESSKHRARSLRDSSADRRAMQFGWGQHLTNSNIH